MKNIKTTVNVNGKQIHSAEGDKPVLISEIGREVNSAIRVHGLPIFQGGVTEGQKVSLNIEVTLECTMNQRAARRAPEVIAAEKAAIAQNLIQDQSRIAEWNAKQKAEQERRRSLCRQ